MSFLTAASGINWQRQPQPRPRNLDFMVLRVRWRFFAMSFILSILCQRVAGQTAELSGYIRDASQAVIAGATITAVNLETRAERVTRSNRLGYYSLTFLQPGEHSVRVQAPGLKSILRPRIILNVGSQLRLDFVLQVEGGTAAITVRGDTFGRDETAAVSTTIDRKFVANLPLNGRTFQALISLVPGVTSTLGDGQFSVSGQRDDANYLTVDGVSGNVGLSAFRSLQETAGGTVPGFSVLGTTSNLVPADSMQEFTVQTSSYSAEFGRVPGGQIQILTRSGTSQFHGGLFNYFRNEALDANDWFSNADGFPRAPLRQNDFGGVFGGPLVRDRTFFFLSYEGLRLRQPQFAEVNVPSLSARTLAPAPIAQLLNAFPVPNGPQDPVAMIGQFSAAYSNPVSLDSGSIRVDQAISRKLTLFSRFVRAPSHAQTRADSLTHVISTAVNTTSLTLGATVASTPALTNDFRFNYTKYESSHFNTIDNFGGAVPPPESLLFPAPFASPSTSRFIFFDLADGLHLVSGRSSDHLQRQLNFVNALSILIGSHSLKFGVDYRYLAPVFGPQDYGQSINFRTLSDAVAGKTPRVPIFAFDKLVLSFHNLSLYWQDAWRPTNRVTFSYGIRWELNPPPSGKGEQSLYTLLQLNDIGSARVAPAGTQLYRTTYANFAPRFGVAYELLRRPGSEAVAKAGFGIFYDLGSGVIGEAAESFPHFRQKTVTGRLFPIGDAGAPPPFPSLDPPYSGQSLLVFDPKISLPRTYQWNLAVQQLLGTTQSISASYVGAAGRKLLRRVSMLGSSPNFTDGSVIDLTANTATSDYHALQLQFQRRLSQGLQALISYCWSHSIDISSSDIATQIPSKYVPPEQNRGPSDFDVRHSMQLAFTYELPRLHRHLVNRLFSRWLFASIFVARTETPLDVTVKRSFGVDVVAARPDLVPGAPLYLQDRTVAGGRRINPSAFVLPVEERQGTLGRNVFRGFPLSQLDLSLERTFNIVGTASFQIRADSFNVLNHPNFANPSGDLSSDSLFGVSTAMANTPFTGITNGLTPLFRSGGPRSLQLSLRFNF